MTILGALLVAANFTLYFTGDHLWINLFAGVFGAVLVLARD